jgi:hypothetical protein
LFTVVAVGAVFILIGIVFVTAPNIINDAGKFFSDFRIQPVANTSIFLPAPTHPADHAELYGAIAQFALGVAILQVLMIMLRLALSSPIGRIAETVGNLVFWFGAFYMVITFLNNKTTMPVWFEFWAGIIVFIGVSLIARGLVLLAKR